MSDTSHFEWCEHCGEVVRVNDEHLPGARKCTNCGARTEYLEDAVRRMHVENKRLKREVHSQCGALTTKGQALLAKHEEIAKLRDAIANCDMRPRLSIKAPEDDELEQCNECGRHTIRRRADGVPECGHRAARHEEDQRPERDQAAEAGKPAYRCPRCLDLVGEPLIHRIPRGQRAGEVFSCTGCLTENEALDATILYQLPLACSVCGVELEPRLDGKPYAFRELHDGQLTGPPYCLRCAPIDRMSVVAAELLTARSGLELDHTEQTAQKRARARRQADARTQARDRSETMASVRETIDDQDTDCDEE